MGVRNFLYDGAGRESMEGIMIPAGNEFYSVLMAILREREKAA